MYSLRQKRLETIIESTQLDAIALNAGPSLTYLTGLHFHLMERPVVLLLVPGKQPTIILPELEQKKLDSVQFPLSSYTYPEDPSKWESVFQNATQSLSLYNPQIGAEPTQLRFLEYDLISKCSGNSCIIDAANCLAELRAIKDANEIGLMRKAVAIAQDALTATLPLVRVGVTEKELANELVIQLLKHGSDPVLPFSPIVASGPNSANPHAKPSKRQLSPGDLLVIDWGATWQGYASDLTRTFAITEVTPECERIHRIVQEANRAGRNAGKPGVTCKSIDDATRTIIENGGYGPYFTHRTGHGIGLECHEHPYIRSDNNQILAEGMTYTVEPGIYLTGKNGVRIEDDVVITSDGAESLSNFPREMQIIG